MHLEVVRDAVGVFDELNRDVLVPRPAGRFMFGRLIGRESSSDGKGGKLHLLPPGAGASAGRTPELLNSPEQIRALPGPVADAVAEALAQATQSVFFAMTELCKGRKGSYQPASAAVRALQQGKYRADLGAP